MNWKRFLRVLAGQAAGIGAALAVDMLAASPVPDALKFPVASALGAYVNAAAKEARERAKWADRRVPPLAKLF